MMSPDLATPSALLSVLNGLACVPAFVLLPVGLTKYVVPVINAAAPDGDSIVVVSSAASAVALSGPVASSSPQPAKPSASNASMGVVKREDTDMVQLLGGAR